MPLIKQIAEIKKYLAVDANTRIESISPYIDEAEIVFLIDLIGRPFYEEVLAIYDAGDYTGEKAKYQALIPMIQRPLINYAFFLSSSMYGVSVSDVGIQVNQTSESAPAPLWKIQKIEEAWLNSAYTFADVLLNYLEEKAEDFATWAEGPTSPFSQELFISKTSDFEKIRSIAKSRRTFLALKPFIKEAEPLVERALGSELFDELKQQLKENDLTDENKLLLNFVRPVVAFYALIEAIPLLNISISADSILVNSYNNGLVKKDAPTEKQLEKLLQSLRNRLSISLEQLKMFLTDKVEDYPLYAAHINHTSERVGVTSKRYLNRPGSKNFLIG
jgi:hypothetical protein